MRRLYKFISDAGAVPFLLRGLIKFTPPAELNDPSELSAHVIHEEVVESLNRLRADGYTEADLVNLRSQENLFQRLAPEFQAVKVPSTTAEATALIRSSFYDQISLLEGLLAGMVHEVSAKVGFFCLSLRYDSLPMWAHYANNAAGLVVEFVRLEEVFQGDNTGVLSQLMAVRYERDRRSVTFETKSHETLFFEKFADWSYEKEVRVVLPLDDCQRQYIGDRQIAIRQIPSSCISRVILGWNMPINIRQSIRSQVQEINPDVDVVEARIVRGRVELGFSV